METLNKILILGMVIASSPSFASVGQVQVCKIKITKVNMLDALKEVEITLSRDSILPSETEQRNCATFAHAQALFAKDKVSAPVEVTFNIETRSYMIVE